jgi:hypothetical protein
MMADYGVLPQGFRRKELSLILAEVEAALITEFGPDVIQSAQSPLGQINGVFAEAIAILWELLEDAYQSYDPDQAEAVRLDTLARIRILARAGGESDESFRQAITNFGRARIDIQDIVRAIRALDGVTYTQVFLNDGDTIDANGIAPGQLAVCVLGGDDEAIAAELRRYIVPGVTTTGNFRVESNIDGFCRSFPIVRPIVIPASLQVWVNRNNDRLGCPPPSLAAIRDALFEDLTVTRPLINGEDITLFRIRQAVEGRWQGSVEVVRFNGEREEIAQSDNQPISFGFIELASLDIDDITVSLA